MIEIHAKANKETDDFVSVSCSMESSDTASQEELVAIIATVFLKLKFSSLETEKILELVKVNCATNHKTFKSRAKNTLAAKHE